MYKLIRIAYDAALDEYLVKLIERYHMEKYIKIPQVEAQWTENIRHFNNHIWPGTDSIIILVLESLKAEEFCDCLRKLKKETHINFNAIVIPIEEMI